MTIYEFSTWWGNKEFPFKITEIEVEEKPKTYIGKNRRIKKSDIDKLNSSFGNVMYRLDNNPEPFIAAMIKRKEERVDRLSNDLFSAKEDLEKWRNLMGK